MREREKERERAMNLDPPPKMENHSITVAIKSVPLFNKSDISGYQVPDRCGESKRACGDEEK